MQQVQPISGFPEWLPGERLLELELLDNLREQFELFGFSPVETRAVEPLDVLLAKGETDQEIYVVSRLQDPGSEMRYGLHYDLTVPLARYVVEHEARLQFPFRRYQIQKAWRGERPQRGRFREFYQADIDVVGRGAVPQAVDAEMLMLLHDALGRLPGSPQVEIRINSRRLLSALYQELGISAADKAIRAVDKIRKIGEEGVRAELRRTCDLDEPTAARCTGIAGIAGIAQPEAGIAAALRDLGVGRTETSRDALAELCWIFETARPHVTGGSVVIDLSIARGADYYTGLVLEGFLKGMPELGAVCSGGRYDNLAASIGAGLSLPGVGVSIGVSRLMSYLLSTRGQPARVSPAQVVIMLKDENSRAAAYSAARSLRARGVAAEVYPEPDKYGKQIRYASSRGIPYVLFIDEAATMIRDLRAASQYEVDLESWLPAAGR